MSDVITATTTPPISALVTDPEPAAIRAQIVGNNVSIPNLARALNVTDRSIYNLIAKYRIPFVKVCNQRLLEPADFKAAVLRDQANAPPRRPGRPRTRKAT
jgi:excisionase family DNA binding protein